MMRKLQNNMRNARNNGAKKSLGFIQAKKALGQNFLKSEGIARALVGAAHIQKTDIVIEVGPGKGIITQFLLEETARVIAVEKDARMIELLKEKFSQEIADKKLILVHDDILKFEPRNWKLEIGNWKLIGSIPYYITGKFLKYFLQETATQPSTITLIIQKEVANRICGSSRARSRDKESILSISVKAYGIPRYIKTVSRKLFSPEPNVDSAIIVIENISRAFFSDISEELFFTLLKAGFASKRKKLISNIKKQFPKTNWETVFSDENISQNIRAEDIALEQWQLLCINILKSDLSTDT